MRTLQAPCTLKAILILMNKDNTLHYSKIQVVVLQKQPKAKSTILELFFHERT